MAHHCFSESLELGHSFVWFVSLSFQTVPMLLWPQIYFFWWGALGVWKCEGTDSEPDSSATQWESKTVTIRTWPTDFIYFTRCTDTGVIATHAFIFLLASGPIVMSTHAQLAVVTQSCALLYIAVHCDLLLQ